MVPSVPERAPVPERVPAPELVEGSHLRRLIERATAADGSPPFSDGSLVALGHATRELLWIDDVAAAILADDQAEFVVDPDARGRGHGTAMLETLLSRSPAGLRIWAHGDHPAARALAASHGLAPARELLHLSRALEVPTSDSPSRETLSEVGTSAVRPFVVGRDEEAWVALNALIFAAHPEQGAVTLADVVALEREPWFSADDFLLLWREDILIGYCWLKVEGAGSDAGNGEFYVVGVHPDHQGEKLGGRLFAAGLARMTDLGLHRAHLYVEGDSAPALGLYRSRGFEQDAIDIQYAPAAPPRPLPPQPPLPAS